MPRYRKKNGLPKSLVQRRWNLCVGGRKKRLGYLGLAVSEEDNEGEEVGCKVALRGGFQIVEEGEEADRALKVKWLGEEGMPREW